MSNLTLWFFDPYLGDQFGIEWKWITPIWSSSTRTVCKIFQKNYFHEFISIITVKFEMNQWCFFFWFQDVQAKKLYQHNFPTKSRLTADRKELKSILHFWNISISKKIVRKCILYYPILKKFFQIFWMEQEKNWKLTFFQKSRVSTNSHFCSSKQYVKSIYPPKIYLFQILTWRLSKKNKDSFCVKQSEGLLIIKKTTKHDTFIYVTSLWIFSAKNRGNFFSLKSRYRFHACKKSYSSQRWQKFVF